jgi:hypothetical protein
MFKRAGVGVLALLLVLGTAWSTAVAQEKTKGKAKADAAKTVEGEVVSLDVKKLSVVVKTDNGNQTVSLDKDVKVVGPRGGARKDGLEDEQLDKGAKILLTMSTGGKTAKEIKLLSPAPVPAITKTAPAGTKSTETKTETKAAGTTKSGSTTKSAVKTTKTTTTDVKGPSGKIVKVDLASSKFTIVDEAGKRTEFSFDSDTLFLGPRGGQGDKNGKDDRFVIGAPVHLLLGVSGKAVKEVHLPYRSAIEK